jgi:hypothetical protein
MNKFGEEPNYPAFINQALQDIKDRSKSCDSPMLRNAKTSENITEKITKHMKEISDRMYSLYSRNMILEKYFLLNNGELTPELYDEFKNKFIDSHPYSSIRDLFKELNTPFSLGSNQVVFTFSEPYVLEKQLESNCALVQAEKLHEARSRNEKQKLIETLIADDSKSIIVIQFSSLQDCLLLAELKLEVFDLSNTTSKHFVFVLHIKSQDLEQREKYFTGMSATDPNLRLLVIDDLEDSSYDTYFGQLDKNNIEHLEMLLNNPMSTIKTMPLWRQLKEFILNSVKETMLGKLEKQKSSLEISKGIEQLRGDDGFLIEFCKIAVRLTTGSDIKTIKELLKADNASKAGLHTDVEYYLASLIKDSVSIKIQTIVNSLDALNAFTFLIRLTCVKDENSRKQIFENRILPMLKSLDHSTRYGSSDPTEINESIYDNIINMIKWEEVSKLVKNNVSRLSESIREKRAQKISGQGYYAKQAEIREFIAQLIFRFVKVEINEQTKEEILLFPEFGLKPVELQEEMLFFGIYATNIYSHQQKKLDLSLIQSSILMEILRIFLSQPIVSQKFGSFTLVEILMSMIVIYELYYENFVKMNRLLPNKEDSKTTIEALIESFKEGF